MFKSVRCLTVIAYMSLIPQRFENMYFVRRIHGEKQLNNARTMILVKWMILGNTNVGHTRVFWLKHVSDADASNAQRCLEHKGTI